MKDILILDACEQTRLVLRPFLGEQGYSLTFVATAAEALSQLWEKSFQLIILDTTDPALKGEELLKTLRAADPERRQTLIAFVEEGRQQEQERLVALGADSCLTKPIDFHDMTMVLDRLMARHTETA